MQPAQQGAALGLLRLALARQLTWRWRPALGAAEAPRGAAAGLIRSLWHRDAAQPAPLVIRRSIAQSSAGEADAVASSSSSSSSSADKASVQAELYDHNAKLQAAGMWFHRTFLRSLPTDQMQSIQKWHEGYRRLLKRPAAGLTLVSLPHQLAASVVAVTSDRQARRQEAIQQHHQKKQQKRADAASAGSGGVPSRAYSTDGAAAAAAAPSAGSGELGGSAADSASSSAGASMMSDGAERTAPAAAGAARQQAQPMHGQLSSHDFAGTASREPRIVNLNSQMRQAAAAGKHTTVVELFDSMLAKGLREAAAQQQEQQQQQQQQGKQEGQQQQAVLPKQYRPDADSLATYCKSLAWLAEKQVLSSSKSWSSSASSSLAGGQVRQEQAEAVLALWGDRIMKGYFAVYVSAMAVFRAVGANDKALGLFRHLQETLRPEQLNKHSRLHSLAAMAALQLNNYEAASDIAKGFSNQLVPFTAQDYTRSLAFLYRHLAGAAATAQDWDGAIYWLQQLINHDNLVSVEPSVFIYVLNAACDVRRMDVVRVMMTAIDTQLAARGRPPYQYELTQMQRILRAAGRAGDAALITSAWERLRDDARRALAGRRHAADAGADGAAEGGAAAAAAAGEEDAELAAAAAAGAPPPLPAGLYHSAMAAYVDCQQYGKAFELLNELEAVHCSSSSSSSGSEVGSSVDASSSSSSSGGGGSSHGSSGANSVSSAGPPAACSVYGGLRFFPEALCSEAQLAAAFAQLQARQEAGARVSTAMMNVICRAVARLGSTEATGKVFEGYAAWGLAHDADSYNTVMESCEAAKKVAAVEGLLSYMVSKGVAPNNASWSLLLSTAVRAEDVGATASALRRMAAAGVTISRPLAWRVWHLAQHQRGVELKSLLQRMPGIEQLPLQPLRRGGGSAEVWRAGQPLRVPAQPREQRWRQPKQQQQQQQQRQRPREDVWRPGLQQEQQREEPVVGTPAAAEGMRDDLLAALRAGR